MAGLYLGLGKTEEDRAFKARSSSVFVFLNGLLASGWTAAGHIARTAVGFRRVFGTDRTRLFVGRRSGGFDAGNRSGSIRTSAAATGNENRRNEAQNKDQSLHGHWLLFPRLQYLPWRVSCPVTIAFA